MTQLGLQVQSLYQEDYALWLDKTVEQIRSRHLETLDWQHLLEEIEDLGRELRNKVDSYLMQLLIHLLLYQYWESQKEWCQARWRDEIDNFRVQLEILFESKTLENYFLERIEAIYVKARRRAITKTQLAPSLFPMQCPFTAEQIMEAEFFPH